MYMYAYIYITCIQSFVFPFTSQFYHSNKFLDNLKILLKNLLVLDAFVYIHCLRIYIINFIDRFRYAISCALMFNTTSHNGTNLRYHDLLIRRND